jgi:ATP-dependent Clp protease adaptor protein ClpS
MIMPNESVIIMPQLGAALASAIGRTLAIHQIPPFLAPASPPTRQLPYHSSMFATATTEVLPAIEQDRQTDSRSDLEPGYLVICWNDPVNLMVYVTHVFQTVFGWERQKAEKKMLEVHRLGKSLLTRESLEKAEFYVHQLQKYNLHATLEREVK